MGLLPALFMQSLDELPGYCWAGTSTQVLSVRDRLEMIRIYARADAAFVVDVHSRRD
jgi:hypothetical protein